MIATVVLIGLLGAVVVILRGVKNKALRYISISIVLGLILVLFGTSLLPRVLGPPSLGKGSYRHARLWRDKLAACDSLDDVRRQFNCGRWQGTPHEGYTHIPDPNTLRDGNTWALLYDFPDGDWLAMAYADSHNTWGGGTVVTRDNTGRIRVFFGHVCGRPFAEGESLEEVYAYLARPPFPLKEVSLGH
jgi:hypothetical protein